MSNTKKALEVSLPSTEIESQALLISVSNVWLYWLKQKLYWPKIHSLIFWKRLSHLLKLRNLCIFLISHCVMKWKPWKHLVMLFPLFIMYLETPPEENKISEPDSSESPQSKHIILNEPLISASNYLLPTLNLSKNLDLHRDYSLKSQFTTEKLQFQSQMFSLNMVSTSYRIQFSPIRYKGQYNLYASQQLVPCVIKTTDNQKFFILQMNFLRPSVFDLYTDVSKPNFQSVNKTSIHYDYNVPFLLNSQKQFIFLITRISILIPVIH